MPGQATSELRACSFDGCNGPHYARGWCRPHYDWMRNAGRSAEGTPTQKYLDECVVDGCSSRAHARDLCPMHYQRWRTTGDPGPAEQKQRGGRWTGAGREFNDPLCWCGKPTRSKNLCNRHYNLIWFAANPERTKNYTETRRARKLAGADLTADEWGAILDAYGHRCAYCHVKPSRGKRGGLTQDHVVPLYQGGRHTASNVVPACGSCNFRKNRSTVEEWAARGGRGLLHQERMDL